MSGLPSDPVSLSQYYNIPQWANVSRVSNILWVVLVKGIEIFSKDRFAPVQCQRTGYEEFLDADYIFHICRPPIYWGSGPRRDCRQRIIRNNRWVRKLGMRRMKNDERIKKKCCEWKKKIPDLDYIGLHSHTQKYYICFLRYCTGKLEMWKEKYSITLTECLIIWKKRERER